MWILDNEFNPFLLAFLGCVACLAAFVGWIMSGRKEALYAAAGLFIFFVALIIVERLMISDREAIRETIIHIARSVEKNDHQAVYAAIHPKAVDVLTLAQSEMPQYRFQECRITRVEETVINSTAKPKTAEVEFYVAARGSFKEGGFAEQSIPRIVRLFLEQDSDGKWKVTNYTHRAPLETP